MQTIVIWKLPLGSLCPPTVDPPRDCEFLKCADRHTAPMAEHPEALARPRFPFRIQLEMPLTGSSSYPTRRLAKSNGVLGAGMEVTDQKKNEELNSFLFK